MRMTTYCKAVGLWLIGFVAPMLCASALWAQAAQVRFEHIVGNTQTQLGQVDTIFQDSVGFIWMGGENGLIRYDGYDFKVYRYQPDNNKSLSNNTVWAIVEDENSDLWIATEGGVSRYLRQYDHFQRFQHQADDDNSLSNDSVRAISVGAQSGMVYVGTFGGGVNIINPQSGDIQRINQDSDQRFSLVGDNVWSVLEASDGALWIGTEGAGAVRYMESRDELDVYRSGLSNEHRIAHDTVRAIYEDKQGQLWLGTDGGLHRIGLYGNVEATWQYQAEQDQGLSSNIIWDIRQDSYGFYWIATDGGGLNRLDADTGEVHVYSHDDFDPFSISSNVVRQVIEDRSGDIWTANFPNGANVFHRNAERVELYRYRAPQDNGLNHSSVLSFYQSEDGILWIGTDGGGLNRFDRVSGGFEHYLQGPAPDQLSSNAILSIEPGVDGQLWLGTWGGGLNLFDPQTGKVQRFDADPQDFTALANKNVWSLLVDNDDALWVGTEGGGLQRFNNKSATFERFPYSASPSASSLLGSIVWSMAEDSQGRLWVGTDLGLNLFDKRNRQFQHFQHSEEHDDSLSNGSVLSLFFDRDEQLWVGTRAGLNRLKEDGGFERIGLEQGLINDVITSIRQDAQGRLWLGTSNGLSRYDPITKQVRNYHQSTWAQGKFNFGSAYRLLDGTLAFGGVNGFVLFEPENLRANAQPPPIVLTDFQILNQRPEIGAEGSPLQQSLSATKVISLGHKQSVFSFKFAALNYLGSQNNHYAYWLEGFDQGWNFVGTQRSATYTNLSPGEYVFHVMASNNEGVWNREGLRVHLHISPPPWLTWWAYTLYLLVLVSAVWLYLRSQQIKIEKERAINEKLRSLDKLKDNFLANTSHELRTPLNGIIGLADTLVEGSLGQLSPIVQYNLETIANSAKRLSSLVNDILDFSYLKKDKIELEVKPQNLRLVVEDVVAISRPLIGNKDIDLSNGVDAQLPAVMADDTRLQQILHNLVGNAIKFTESGSILVTAEIQDERLWVHIKDTGIGIATENLTRIFDSFQQLEHHHKRSRGGTGLGLSITRQLVQLHGGELLVSSSPGLGSTFSFSLQYTDDIVPRPRSPEKTVNKMLDISRASTLRLAGQPGEDKKPEPAPPELAQFKQRQSKILIVDDEPVNRQVLVNQLSQYDYQLFEVANGQDALDAIREQDFDLVLLDIMMPGMSGYDVCMEIRRHYSIHELPVIFLTAKNLISDLVDGFDVGANDFLTKPLAKGELVSRVRTHLQLLDINQHLEARVKARTEEVELANKVLETLDGIVATINQEVILERLVDVLLREARQLFARVHCCVYWNYDQDLNEYETFAHCGFTVPPVKDRGVAAESFDRFMYERGQRLSDNIALISDTKDMPGIETFAEKHQPHSMIIMAVRFDDCIVGYISLMNLESQDALGHCDLHTLQRFYAHARSALLKARLMQALKKQNKELEDAQLTDALTGLRNRRYLLKYLDADVALTLRLHRAQQPATPMPPNSDLIFYMIDIDEFRQVNENHGRAAGDRVLVQLKALLEEVFRESDFMVRWGGEEFLVVARFSNRKAAPVIAERLKRAIAKFAFDIGLGKTVKLSCSTGFASFPYLVSDPLAFSWSQVIDIAEMCLYAAKRSGRNGWLGLEANMDSEALVDFQGIASKPQQLVEAQHLLLHSSLPPDENVTW